MLRLVTTEIRRNPKLAKCNPWSIVGAVVQCAQLGLEPGSGLGHAYLVPYGDECTLIPGYKGLVDLARRGDKITKVNAHLVYKGDDFKRGIRGGEEFLDWIPKDDPDLLKDENITYVIALAVFVNGATQNTVMRRAEVDKIRDGLRYNSDVWKGHYGEMVKKTGIRRLAKLLPQSPEFTRLLELEDAAADGRTQMRMNMDALLDAGVVDAEFANQQVEAQEERHRKANGEAIRSAPDNAPAVETPKEKAARDTSRAAIVQEFDDAYTTAKGKGLKLGDAMKLLNAEAKDIRNKSVAEIETATDILNDWLKGK